MEQVKKDDIERKAQGMIIVTASTAWLGVCFGTATVVVAMALATTQMRSIFYVVVFVFMLHALNAQRRDVSTNDLAKPKITKLGPHTYCPPPPASFNITVASTQELVGVRLLWCKWWRY